MQSGRLAQAFLTGCMIILKTNRILAWPAVDLSRAEFAKQENLKQELEIRAIEAGSRAVLLHRQDQYSSYLTTRPSRPALRMGFFQAGLRPIDLIISRLPKNR